MSKNNRQEQRWKPPLRWRMRAWLLEKLDPTTHDYTIIVKWDGGGDRAAMELQDAIGRLVRQVDRGGKFGMRGNAKRDTGSAWLAIHRQRAQAWRESRKVTPLECIKEVHRA